MSSERLPFLAEYAKTGRASCKACKEKIAQDVLRIAKVVQSPFHDGVMTNWFHEQCFFTKAKPTTTGDIANFDNIRWEDQQRIQEKIDSCGAGGSTTDASSSEKKGQKRRNNNNNNNAELYRDYKIEYAKSDRSTCKGCEAPIIKNSMRLSKKDYDSEMGQKLNGVDAWHHIDCFVKLRSTFGFFDCGDVLPGFKSLKKEDQKLIKKVLNKIKNENLPPSAKKIKTEPDNDNDNDNDNKDKELMKQQNEKMFKLKDELSTLSKKELTGLLIANNQNIPEGQSAIIDKLADIMSFGVPLQCNKCNDGNMNYKSGIGYKCNGNLTEWTKCENINIDPVKKKFKIPSYMKQDIPFLSSFKPKIEKRIFKQVSSTKSSSSSSSIKNENDKIDGPKVKPENPLPLKGMQFIIHGKNKNDKDDMKKKIMLLGGTVASKIHDNIAAVISNEINIDKGGKLIKDAQDMDIQIVSEDFVDEAKLYNDTPISLIIKKNICNWGSDPAKRVAITMNKSSSSSRGNKSLYEKSSSGKIKLKIKGSGGTVDPDSGIDDIAHVYQTDKNNIYNSTLGLTDIQAGTNKYYKLQILKHDKKNEYWLFRSWGRIGTTIGGKKCDKMSLDNAIEEFKRHYYEKSGNHWNNRNNFIKLPKLMYPIDVDNNNDDDDKLGKFDSEIKSKLKKPIQELIRLIFNVDIMKKVMAEYELDTEKMPLGKLSKKQLQNAYSVLSELQILICKDKLIPGSEKMNLIDASNRFYTLVPHSFGISNPPIIDNDILIKSKTEMLDSLIEMEIAYNLLNIKSDSTQNPIDIHYQQLNTHIDILDKTSDEFKIIQQYTKNTHASTHSQYKLEIDNVFIINRKGEEKRYKPFKKLHNRKLLWHGSRTTNYAGILSQGLRIAPPEAPVTGYMFGKGIYFADMVSKSANYCCTSSQNSTGLLLLCEVALGNMYERLNAEYVEKLPSGKHSTFGVGQTQPDPNIIHKTIDGVEIPYGPGVPAKIPTGNSSLLYNEFIVYDVAQVKSQYLVQMKFEYNY